MLIDYNTKAVKKAGYGVFEKKNYDERKFSCFNFEKKKKNFKK